MARRLAPLETAAIPATARERLQTQIRAQHLFTLSLTADLFRILQCFSDAQVDTVLVKGPVLSQVAYGDPSVRSYVDLDLLVRHRDIQSASNRMMEIGFHPEVSDAIIRAGKIPGEYLFRRPGTQRVVELHTEHSFRYYPKPMRIDDLFARRRRLLLDGREVPALSLEDEFVLMCIHGAKHFWERLLWVSDVAAVLAAHPELDWSKIRNAAQQVGAERMVRVAIQLSSLVLRSEIPSPLVMEIQQDRAVASLCRQIQTWLPYAGAAPPPLPRRALFRLQMAGGGLTGAAYLLRLSLSPTQEDWTEGKEDRRFWLWDALRRPFRLFRKYGSNQ